MSDGNRKKTAHERIFGRRSAEKGGRQADTLRPDLLPMDELVERLFGESRRPEPTAEELEEIAARLGVSLTESETK